MRRLALALVLACISLVPFGGTAVAKCATCFDNLSLQTPDGQPWSSGKPVTLVVTAHRAFPTTEVSPSGVAVVMHTDGDRTKCLEVPIRLVSTSGDNAVYAGVFYPFRAAAYDGKLSFGSGDIYDISFDVRTLAPTTPVASAPDLPVAAPDPDQSYPLSETLPFFAMLAGVPLALGAALAWLLARRRRASVAFA